MRIPLALLVLATLVAVSSVAHAAGLYGNATLEELEKSLRSLLERGGALPIKTVEISLERLASCSYGNVSRVFAEAADMLEKGSWKGELVRSAIVSCPSCLRDCRASDVYTVLLASFSRLIGATLTYSNTSSTESLIPVIGIPPYLWVDAKAWFGGDPRYWSMLATLAIGARIDGGFWRLLEESGGKRLLCVAVTVADARVLGGWAERLLERIAPRGVHPLDSLSRLPPGDRLVCAYAASRLYFITAPPEAQQLYTVFAVGERITGSLSLTALELLMRGTEEHLVVAAGRVARAFLADTVASLGSRLPSGFQYETCCLVESLVSKGVGGNARASCSRSVKLYGIVKANWLTWGKLVYTTSVDSNDVRALEACAGLEKSKALEYCVDGVRVFNVTRAGCIARLAAVIGDKLDWVRVRVCASRILGVKPPSMVPENPLQAWALGFIDTVEPPPADSLNLLEKIVSAWRLAEKLGLKELASRLRSIAKLVAEGNTTGVEREASRLRSLLESIAYILSSNPRLAGLVSQIAALSVEKGVVRVDLEEAARILSSILGVNINASRAAVEGKATDILEMLAKGLIGVEEARKLLEAANIPDVLRDQLLSVVSRIESGDWRLYYQLIRALAPVVAAQGTPRLNLLTPNPQPLLAALLLGLLGAAVYAYRDRLAALAAIAKREARRLDPLQREMQRLLSLLEKRYSVKRGEWETLREYLSRLPDAPRRIVERLVAVYEEARYGGRNRDRALDAVRRARRKIGAQS